MFNQNLVLMLIQGLTLLLILNLDQVLVIHLEMRSLCPKMDIYCVWSYSTDADIIVLSETQ